MSVHASSNRRTQLLDAALRIAGERGLRAVTHRSIEDAAEVPRGSAVYHFRTKPQLIEAMVARLAEVEEHRSADLGHAVAMALASGQGADHLEALIAEIVRWIDTDRAFALAHYELALAGARDDHLRAIMSAAAATLWRLAEPIAVAAGSADSARDARIVVSVLDGLLLDRVTHDPQDDELTAIALRRVFAGIAAS